MTLTIWHNPRCSKSRQTLSILEASGLPIEIRKYLEDAPTIAELNAAKIALAVSVLDMVRRGEKLFKELGLSKDSDDDVLLEAMSQNPILIERPIVFKRDKAVIGRPPEVVQTLL